MASAAVGKGHGPTNTNVSRKKTPGACERCREKRIKCNGAQPCDQCSKKELQCIFTFAPTTGTDALAEKLDLILARIDRLEQCYKEQAKCQQVQVPHKLVAPATKYPSPLSVNGLAQVNQQTGCVEFYGGTSTFVVASSLGKRMRQLEEATETPISSKHPRIGRSSEGSASDADRESLRLDDITSFCDYVVPLNAKRQHRRLRESVADRHLEMFFDTIHVFLPIFDKGNFREVYNTHRSLFGDHRLSLPSPEYPGRQQFLCLLYAILALGALYEDEREDSSAWASWYFAEAQDSLSRLLDAPNLDLVRAAMLMGAYAQHTIKPNLAYMLNGIAIRLAFSIGLNTESMYNPGRFQLEQARRTWWLIYIQEVELSLDSGRPTSIRTSDMDVGYPAAVHGENEHIHQESEVELIRYLAEIAKIMRRILDLANAVIGEMNALDPRVESVWADLQSWRASLPKHLHFYETAQDNGSGNMSLCTWQARQQSSLRIHYNLAVIILFRESHGKQKSRIGMGLDKPSTADYQRSCHDAARDMIKHIHRIFKLAPSLRRWSYYCFYCLQATLVLLTKLVTDGNVPSLDPHTPPSEHYVREDSAEDLSCCELAIQVFQQIDLKASKHCAEVVRRFLEEWTVQIRRKSSRVSTYDQQATTLQENNRNKSHNSNEFVDAGQPIQYWQIPKSNSDPQLDSPKLHPYPASSMEDESFEPFEWQKNVDRSSGGLGPLPFEGADFAGMPSAVDLNSDDTIDFDAAGPATLPILAGLQTELYGALHSSDYDGYNGAFTRPSFPFGQSHGQRWRIGHEKFTWP